MPTLYLTINPERTLLNDIAHFGSSRQDIRRNISKNASLFGLGVRRKELGETDFTLPRHEHNEMPSASGRGGRRSHDFARHISHCGGHGDECVFSKAREQET